ncbi:MAG: hypothetical protein IPJ65_24305 [Archangiaceae bacterium]|nr:hypothetical protein [Archangiaceae bacterium]
MSRRALGAVLAGITFALVLWLWPRGPKDPEGQIRALVGRVVAGAEARDVGPLDSAMADDFKGPEGASRQEVKQIVAFQVLRNQETVAIFNPSLEVKVNGPEYAEVEGTFVFARTKARSAAELQSGSVAAAYRIEAKLEKRGSQWQFVSATYAPVSWP